MQWWITWEPSILPLLNFCLPTVSSFPFSIFLICYFCQYFFVNHFFIFHLDKQHPKSSFFSNSSDKLPVELRIYSSPFLKMSSCTPMWVWVYSRGRPFPYLASSFIRLQLISGWSNCGCLAVFPRLKGRKNVSHFYNFWLWKLTHNCESLLVCT